MGSPVVLDGETRASALPGIKEGAPLRFQMVLAHATASDRVTVSLIDAAGKTVRSGSMNTPGVDAPLDVYFPDRLKPGRYALTARSERGEDAGQELARSQFEVISNR